MIRAEFSDISRFTTQLKRAYSKAEIDEEFKNSVKEVAADFYRNVRPITPIDTGHLKASWTGRDFSVDPLAYASSQPVTKVGNEYSQRIINTAQYASAVEYGHRTRGNGFVNGRFFMREAEGITQQTAELTLHRHIDDYLRRLFD